MATDDAELHGGDAGGLPEAVRVEIERLTAGDLSAEVTAVSLAAIAHRAANDLHRVARREAARRRGTPQWGSWAALANTARDAVLKMAALRRTTGEATSSK